jgi:hypothetical protein
VRTVSPAFADTKTDLIANMKWMNEPASWKRSGDRLLVRSRAKTDFWRKTFYGYISDNGHFFYVSVSGDFVFEARVNGGYAALYDQAGLMVRQNAENWVKVRNRVFRWPAPCQLGFHTRVFGLVHDARFIQDRANLVASGTEERLY